MKTTIKTSCFALLTLAAVGSVQASDTMDAAIGGGLGGAAGAAIGNEVGGRDGAIIGGAVGAAAGAAITTDRDGDRHRHRYVEYPEYGDRHHHGHFCPPGQAKKGNC
jgi:outer membrane lipoprotein SlyB